MTLRWISLRPSEVRRLLNGSERAASEIFSSPDESLMAGLDRFAVGFDPDEGGGRYIFPTAIVVPDETADDLLAWIAIYEPDLFPLSQFCRLMYRSDWNRLADSATIRRSDDLTTWASLVLGETVEDIDQQIAPDSFALNRVFGSYSFAMARTLTLYGHAPLKIAEERLRATIVDSRLFTVRRSVLDMKDIWTTTSDKIPKISEAGLESAVRELLNRVVRRVSGQLWRSDEGRLALPRELFSEQVEARVVAFRQYVSELLAHGTADSSAPRLAAAAILVGRGTTHLFLVRRELQRFPLAAAWFGLLAGALGENAWDGAWLRGAARVRRQLAEPFDLRVLGRSDLCWPDLALILGSMRDPDAYRRVPKGQNSVLNVELLPGVPLELRIPQPVGAQTGGERELRDRLRLYEETMRAVVRLVDAVAPELIDDRPRPAGSRRSTPKSRNEGGGSALVAEPGAQSTRPSRVRRDV